MTDRKIIEIICEKLREDLAVALNAANFAHETAADEENIPDSKYDTLSLEAAYLAEGEAKRAEEIEAALKAYEAVKLSESADHQQVTLFSLVRLENNSGDHITIFLGHEAGGVKIRYLNEPVIIVTSKSPLGSEILGTKVGDVVDIKINDKIIDYEVISIV